MVIYLAALQDIPESLYEAAELDGAGAIKKVWHITVPNLSPGYILCCDYGNHRHIPAF